MGIRRRIRSLPPASLAGIIGPAAVMTRSPEPQGGNAMVNPIPEATRGSRPTCRRRRRRGDRLLRLGARRDGADADGGPDGKIGHAELEIGDSVIMLADEHPDMDAVGPKTVGGTPVSMHVYVEDVDGVFERAIEAGAKSLRPSRTSSTATARAVRGSLRPPLERRHARRGRSAGGDGEAGRGGGWPAAGAPLVAIPAPSCRFEGLRTVEEVLLADHQTASERVELEHGLGRRPRRCPESVPLSAQP